MRTNRFDEFKIAATDLSQSCRRHDTEIIIVNNKASRCFLVYREI